MDTVTHLSVIGIFFAVFCLTAEAHVTACNQGNDTICLEGNASYEGVRMFLKNDNYFWFGTSYAASCPPQLAMTSQCLNVAPQYHNIITRMRMSEDNETESVEQVLNVHFLVPPGSYMACGTRVETPLLNRTIDSVHTLHYSSWSLQTRPHVTWSARPGVSYTLVFWDAGHFRLHGMWVNIRGDRLDGAQEVVPYSGPLNPYQRKNPYVLALYEQNSTQPDIDRQQALDFVRGLHSRHGHVRLDMMVDHWKLIGPVGVGLMRTEVDEMSAMAGREMYLNNNCPHLTSKALKSRSDVAFNMTGVELTVSVEVTYSSPPYTVDSCCHSLPLPQTMRHSDSRLQAMVEPVYTRQEPHVTLIPTPLRDDPFYFAHRMFTLLFVDVTEKIADANHSNFYLHWQRINIRDPMLRTGETTLSYLGAMVPPSAVHPYREYVYLLYEQSGALSREAVITGFTDTDCPQPLANRCNFTLDKFTMDLNLTLVGVSGHRSAPDLWSRLQGHRVLGMAKNAACVDVEGYSDPCPPNTPQCTSSVASLCPSNMAAMLLGLFLVCRSVYIV